MLLIQFHIVGSKKETDIPVVTEKKKRTKTKKPSESIVPSSDRIQQAEFRFSHIPDDDSNDLNKSVSENNSLEAPPNLKPFDYQANEIPESSENRIYNSPPAFANYQTNAPIVQNRMPDLNNSAYMMNMMNLSSSYGLNRPVLNFPNYIIPQQPRLVPVNYYPNIANYNMGNAPVPPRVVAYQPPDIKKTPYYQRLEVIDVFFKFIIQILRSPEQPSVEQIEALKALLDSLVVNKVNDPP